MDSFRIRLVGYNYDSGLTHHANNANPLVAPVFDGFLPSALATHVPIRRVQQLPLERPDACDVWPLPATEGANGRVDDIRAIFEFFEFASWGPGVQNRSADFEVPFCFCFVVTRVYDFVPKLDVAHDFVLVCDELEICEDLRS